jgi:hypothetical protein
MARSTKPKGPVSEQRTLHLTYSPRATHTVATVALTSRGPDGREWCELARWHLRVTTADLAGHSTSDVLRLLLERVLHRLESQGDPADYERTQDHPTAVGPGVPLGTTGGIVGSTPLPGL